MSYNNNSFGEARQLLQYASNLNILNMTKDDFNNIGKGLMRALQYEMKVAQNTGDQVRYSNANNMISELNSMNQNNISEHIVKVMVKELINLLTKQIQEANQQTNVGNNMFNNNNVNAFGNQQTNVGNNMFNNNNVNAFGNQSQQQNNIAFGNNGFCNTQSQAVTPQANLSATFKGSIKQPVVENVSVPKTPIKKELTLEDVVNNYIPKEGHEYPPLYDDTIYKLWYQLDGNHFEYILIEL